MSYFIKISHDNIIELTTDKTLEERLEICQNIIDTYPDKFVFKSHTDKTSNGTWNGKVSNRLKFMADYILLACDKNGEYKILDDTKLKRRQQKELLFSQLQYDYDEQR